MYVGESMKLQTLFTCLNIIYTCHANDQARRYTIHKFKKKGISSAIRTIGFSISTPHAKTGACCLLHERYILSPNCIQTTK